MDNDDAKRLEEGLIEFLNDPEGELFELDREILRQSVVGERNGRPTINIARQIGRALKFRGGFVLVGKKGKGGGKKRKKRSKPELYANPTTIEGPGRIEIEQGSTRGIRFHINARDEFMASRRGELTVLCSHPDVGEREITIGQLRKGSVRATIALPEGAELGSFELVAALHGWQKDSGGIGPDLDWRTKLVVVEPRNEEERKRRPREGDEQPQSGEGELVGLLWKRENEIESWHAGVPGHVDEVPARILAEQAEDYKELEELDDTRIPTIFLNSDYGPLKRYEAARARELTEKASKRRVSATPLAPASGCCSSIAT